MYRILLSAVAATTTAGCGGADLDSDEGDTESSEHAFGGAGHTSITKSAIDRANSIQFNMLFPSLQYEKCRQEGFNPILRGNCDTDRSSGTPLTKYYGKDTFNDGGMQHLHFNLDYVSRKDITWIASRRETCERTRKTLIEAMVIANKEWRAGRKDSALYWVGHALHPIQDSFPAAHAVRTGVNNRTPVDISIWGQSTPPPSLRNHDSIPDGDNAWKTGCNPSSYDCYKDVAKAAVNASAGYLRVASTIFHAAAPNVEAEVTHYMDDATDNYAGYFRCEALSDNVLTHIVPISTHTAKDTFSTMVSLSTGKTPHVLGYSASTGEVVINRVLSAGADLGERSRWKIGVGFTSIVPLSLGTDAHFLAYDSTTGRVAIDYVYPNGEAVEANWTSNWSTGWTAFAPIQLNGTQHVVAYKSGTGRTVIDRVNARGVGTTSVWEGVLPTGFTSVTAMSVHGVSVLLAYDSASGSAAAYRIRASGTGIDKVWSTTWSSGWSLFMPFVIGGETYVLSAKKESGTVAIDRVNADLQGTTSIRRGKWNPGWSLGAPFELGGVSHYLVYNGGSRSIAIDRIR
jgi:hypothetical protein